MKIKILFILLLSGFITFGQSKKEKEQAQKDAQAKLDTLTKSNAALTIKSDSLSKELEKYFGLYTVIKDKVVKKDFDPAKMAAIIDSLKTGRDSLTLKLAAASVKKAQPLDSLTVAKIDSLKKESEGLLYTVNLLRGKPAKSPQNAKEFIG
nr:hypothetical protein [Chryseolinea sp.]